MPRQSSEAKLIALPARAFDRLQPPDDLTAVQRDLWLACTAERPADWFTPATAPLLLEYVRAQSMCEELESKIRMALSSDQMGDLKTLLILRDRESKRVAMVGTKLRLTQQSRYTPQAAATATRKTGSRPWE